MNYFLNLKKIARGLLSKIKSKWSVLIVIFLTISCNQNKDSFKDSINASADGYNGRLNGSMINGLISDEYFAPGIELEEKPLQIVTATENKEIWIPRSLFISGLEVTWSQDVSKVFVKGRIVWNQNQYQSSGDITFKLMGRWQSDSGVSDLVLVSSETNGIKSDQEVKGRIYCVSVGSDGACQSTITEIFVRVKKIYIFSGQGEFWNGQFKQDEMKQQDDLEKESDPHSKTDSDPQDNSQSKVNKEQDQQNDDHYDDKNNEILRDEIKGSDKGLEVTGGTNENNLDELFNQPDVSHSEDPLLPPPIQNTIPGPPLTSNPGTFPPVAPQPLTPQRDDELETLLNKIPLPGHKPPKSDPNQPKPGENQPIPDQGEEKQEEIQDKNGDLLRGGKLIGYYKPFQSIGIPSKGQLQNATSVVEVIKNIEKLGVTQNFPLRSVRNSDGNVFGNYASMEFLIRSSYWLKQLRPSMSLEVNDISSQKGGRLRPHASHQNGLDMDIGFFFKNLNQNYYGKEAVVKGKLDSNFDQVLQWNFFKTIMKFYSDKIFMIFVHPKIKKALCQEAYKSGDLSLKASKSGTLTIAQETLRRLVPESGHDDHFHARLRCPKERSYTNKKGIEMKSRCVETKGDLPAVTGCAALR